MALISAAAYGNVDEVTRLLSAGANVNQRNAGQMTALHVAAERNFPGVVNVLLAAPGVMVDALDSSGATPLWLAAYHGNVRIMDALIEKGANIFHVNNEGESIIDVFLQELKFDTSYTIKEWEIKRNEMIQKLLKLGARPNYPLMLNMRIEQRPENLVEDATQLMPGIFNMNYEDQLAHIRAHKPKLLRKFALDRAKNINTSLKSATWERRKAAVMAMQAALNENEKNENAPAAAPAGGAGAAAGGAGAAPGGKKGGRRRTRRGRAHRRVTSRRRRAHRR